MWFILYIYYYIHLYLFVLIVQVGMTDTSSEIQEHKSVISSENAKRDKFKVSTMLECACTGDHTRTIDSVRLEYSV